MPNRVLGALPRPISVLLLLWALFASPAQLMAAEPLSLGDVMVGLGSSADGTLEGEVRHFSASGVLRQSLFTNSGSFEENGMCMDAARNLYTTNFDANSMSKFDVNGTLLQSSFGTGFNQHPNSCIFDASGALYVGQSDKDGDFGGGGLLKLDQDGNVLGTFSPAIEQRGTDWIDLAADQCTFYYTSAGSTIKRFDVCANAQLPDFCTSCDDGAGGAAQGPFFALRLLSDGGLLVADWNGFVGAGVVRRYDAAGQQVMSYEVVDSIGLFFPWALALDPDGTSFWIADNVSGDVFRYDLAAGTELTRFVAGDCSDFLEPCAITGLTIVGEPTAATQGGDVSVIKTAAHSVINAGDIASYSIQVTAGGPGQSTNVVLADALPAGLTWTVRGPDGSSCAPVSPVAGGTTLTCSFGTLPAGATRTITLTATTTAANCGAITNSASVSATGDTNSGSNSSGPVTITVNCPDVSVALTTSTPVITAGATATYSVTVNAGGSSSSTNVTLSDALPGGMNWTISGADAAACAPASPVAGGTTLTCSFGTMASGTSKTIVLNAVTTASSCPGISNSASVSAAGDTNSGNNAAGPVAIAVNCPDVSVSLTTSTPVVMVGGNADYAISVAATGSGSSTNVVLTDSLPAGLSWTVQGPDAAACGISGGVLTCSFGTVAQGASRSVTLRATTTSQSCGSISSTASVSAAVDMNAGNNTSGPVGITINCPDVSIMKTTSTPVVVAGMPVSYTITVTAGGTGASTNVVMTDPLPTGLSWTVGGPDAASCSPASPVSGGTTLTCSFGTMSPGASKSITLTATSTNANCPSISNTASVTSDGDTNAGNNTTSAVAITVNQSTASSTAFGESITLNVLPLLGSPVTVTSGPLAPATGSAPPAYARTNQVGSVNVSTSLTGNVLTAGLVTNHASSDLLAGNNVAADSTVTQLGIDVGVGLLKLLHVGATVVQTSASISGSCGNMTATGTTTLVGSTVSVLGLPPLTVPVNPAPNTVLVNALGIKIVLNEQIVSGDGVSSRGLTVNAIHIYLNNAHVGGGLLGGVFNGEIIVASSHAEHDCAGGHCSP